MITTNSAINGTCGLNITTNRNRVKTYGPNVYLKDGQKFELELHNPYTYKVLAKIKLNGYYISMSGIVLNPGQRIYLERFLDKDESFIFSTYDVEGTAESAAAIAFNGDVEVEYYAQHIPSSVSLLSNWGTGTINGTYSVNTPISTNFYAANIAHTAGVSSVTTANFSSVSELSAETGRIDGGKKTGQKFGSSSDSFNSWAIEFRKIKILPISAKPIEVSELRNYCTNCGTRVKKASWKFCPSCGTKM